MDSACDVKAAAVRRYRMTAGDTRLIDAALTNAKGKALSPATVRNLVSKIGGEAQDREWVLVRRLSSSCVNLSRRKRAPRECAPILQRSSRTPVTLITISSDHPPHPRRPMSSRSRQRRRRSLRSPWRGSCSQTRRSSLARAAS